MPLLLTPLLAGFVIMLWTTTAQAGVIAGWSWVTLLYFMFLAPTDCSVRDANRLRCYAPANGLLRGCANQLHRRAYVQRYTRLRGRQPQWWRTRAGELVSSPKNALTALGALIALTSGLSATLVDLLV